MSKEKTIKKLSDIIIFFDEQIIELKKSRDILVSKEMTNYQKAIVENVICFASDARDYKDREKYITRMFEAFKISVINEQNKD